MFEIALPSGGFDKENPKAPTMIVETRLTKPSDFMTDSNEDPLDRTVFTLNPEQWDAFQALLEAPPRQNPRLERLLREPGICHTQE